MQQVDKEYAIDKYYYFESKINKVGFLILKGSVKHVTLSNSGGFEIDFGGAVSSKNLKTTFCGSIMLEMKSGEMVYLPESVPKLKIKPVEGIILVE